MRRAFHAQHSFILCRQQRRILERAHRGRSFPCAFLRGRPFSVCASAPRAGAHVLVPNANDKKAFGPYLQHYAIILDFNKDMNVSVQDFIAQAIKLGFGPNPTPRSIEQMAAAPADLTAAKDVKWSKASKRGWPRRTQTPAMAFENSAKALSNGIDAALAFVTYINAHRSTLVVSGMQIQAKDQRTLDEIAPLMKAYQDAGERFVAAAAERSGVGRELGCEQASP